MIIKQLSVSSNQGSFASKQDDTVFAPYRCLESFSLEFICSVPMWVSSGSSGLLPQSKDMQVRLTGCFKLQMSMSVSVMCYPG